MQFAYKSKNISYFYLKTGTNIRKNFFSIDNTMLNVYFFIYLGNSKIFRSAKGQHFLLEKVSKSQPFYGQDSCRYPVSVCQASKSFLHGNLGKVKGMLFELI